MTAAETINSVKTTFIGKDVITEKQSAVERYSLPELRKTEMESPKGPVVPSIETIESEKKKQQRILIISAVVIVALAAGAVWYFTRKRKA